VKNRYVERCSDRDAVNLKSGNGRGRSTRRDVGGLLAKAVGDSRDRVRRL